MKLNNNWNRKDWTVFGISFGVCWLMFLIPCLVLGGNPIVSALYSMVLAAALSHSVYSSTRYMYDRKEDHDERITADESR